MNIASDIFGSSNNNKLPLILERHRKKIFHLREMFSIVFCLQYKAELQYRILLIIHPQLLAWLAVLAFFLVAMPELGVTLAVALICLALFVWGGQLSTVS